MDGPTDDELAAKYGGYAGFRSAASPAVTDYHGENPAAEMDRLLRLHARADSRVLDIGCGAGETLCQLAPAVREAWGIDLAADLVAGAHRRVAAAELGNVTLVAGDITDAAAVEQLPDDHFDLAFTRRGPHLNAALARKLRPDALFIQELVSQYNGWSLQTIFGRQAFTPTAAGLYGLLGHYAGLDFSPVSVKEYFYEEFFRDADHLAAFLAHGAMLSNWRLPPKPYDPAQDRAALELYARYNATPRGIRVLRHHSVLVLRRARVHYYPADPSL